MVKRRGIRRYHLNGDTAFDVLNTIFMICLMIITLYPFLYVLFSSLSNATELAQHRGILLKPAGFSIESYKLVFENPMIFVGYGNTFFYVIAGTAINLALTILGAYALSRKNVMWSR